MAKYVATILLELEDSFEGRKPEERMINNYLENKIKNGVVKEESFRRKVILNILNVNISVMQFE